MIHPDKSRCPTCHKPWGNDHKRICQKCGYPILLHHKYYFNGEGKIQHRNCKNPELYTKGIDESKLP